MLDVYRAAVLLVLVACYSPSYSNCSIACTDSCPNSLTCDSQLHVCRASGTTCSGDGGVGSDANHDMDAHSDGPKDAPADAAPGGCTYVQELSGGQDGGNLTLDFGTMPIAAGDFVVVAIAGRGASNLNTVSDLNSHQFTRAIQSQITAAGAMTTSAIYYVLAAPATMQVINVNWAGGVTQTVIVSEWHCGAPPAGLSRTGMTNGASSGTSTDTGDLIVPQPSLVVATLTGVSNAGEVLQTPGFTLLDQTSQSGTSGSSTNIAVWGVVSAGTDVDVTFSTVSGSPFAGTAAAFTVQ